MWPREAVPYACKGQFDCIVLEDREDFAKPELFPGREGRGWLIWSIWKKYAGTSRPMTIFVS